MVAISHSVHWASSAAMLAAVLLARLGCASPIAGYNETDVQIEDPDLSLFARKADAGPLTWQPMGNCRNSPLPVVKTQKELRFQDGRSFSVEQKQEKKSYWSGSSVGVYGVVNFRPAASSPGSVTVESISNDEQVKAQVHVTAGGNTNKQQLRIVTPVSVSNKAGFQQSCIQVRVTVDVPKSGRLDNLALDLTQFGVDFGPGLNLAVKNQAIVRTVSGRVRAPATEGGVKLDKAPWELNAPRVDVRTTSGDIVGQFPLDDVLKVQSTSGNVVLQALPKVHSAAAGDKLRQAALSVVTTSGNIVVDEPLINEKNQAAIKLPARDYSVVLSTTSGQVRANMAVTSSANIKSTSGDLVVKVLPLVPAGQKAQPTLRTNTLSGKSSVTVFEASGPGSFPALQSSHQTMSGFLDIIYPAGWSGQFTASTMSGSKSAKGDQLQIQKSNKSILQGRKGSGGSVMRAKTMSGDIRIKVGN